MAASGHPLRRMAVVTVVSLASIANAPRLPMAWSAGPAAQRTSVEGPASSRSVPILSHDVRGVMHAAVQRGRLPNAASHAAAAQRAPIGTAAAPTLAEFKAAFLFNITKFTEWPVEALPPAAPLVFCVADGSAVQTALKEATKGALVRGHAVAVRQANRDGPFDDCHLLYVEGLDSKSALQLLERVKGAPVLSVSDFDSFAQRGGGAHLFIENGRMRFAVNLDAIRRIQLRLSAVFLNLSKVVSDDPNYR